MKRVFSKISAWSRPRIRLFSIYCELGFLPWIRPRRQRKPRKTKKKSDGVYMGAREAIIPFLNDDAKRTFSHLLFRPGYMMRDYILRGQHEHYLAPLTALLVYYSIFSLLLAVINPSASRESIYNGILTGIKSVQVQEDSLFTWTNSKLPPALLDAAHDAIVLPRLDQYPEEADTPWKQSLAAVEGNIRSKGIPLFLGGFLLLWLSMASLLKKYRISFSGAAAASAYIMCQFCLFMFLALLLTWGKSSELGFLLSALLLFIDYRQLLDLGNKPAFWLTVKTGLLMLVFRIVLFLLIAGAVVLLAFARV